MEAHRNNLLRLIEADDLEALCAYVHAIDDTPTNVAYETYILTYAPTCKMCNAEITVSAFRRRTLRLRHLDCSAVGLDSETDCHCLTTENKHAPHRAQFFCSDACYDSYKALFERIQAHIRLLRSNRGSTAATHFRLNYVYELETPRYDELAYRALQDYWRST